MQWDVGTVAFTIELRGRKVINMAALQRFYGMLSIRYPNENNGKRRGVLLGCFPQEISLTSGTVGLSIQCFNPFTEHPCHLYEDIFFRFTAFEHFEPVVGCVQQM